MKSYYFAFCKDSLLLTKAPDGSYGIALGDAPPTETKTWTHLLEVSPMDDGTPVVAYSVDSPTAAGPGQEWKPLRQTYYVLPREFYLKAGKCAELLYWDVNTRFCGMCGSAMQMSTPISKKCTHCGKEVWPQLQTAIIVRITRGDEILLAQGRNFRTNFYGLIAGFVETGETLEEAVCREVMEETGIAVSNISYFGSQPWPYPSGLMVGFTASYAGGELHRQREELRRLAWFRRDSLPELPEKLSIARQLIDDWIFPNGEEVKE